jgi:nucleoside-diphosphate-sugar epimerase
VTGDVLDDGVLRSVVLDAQPDQVVHLLTALPPGGPQRSRHLHATNVLRTAGTRNLLDAAVAAGARRLVAESFVGVYGMARFDTPASEDVRLPPAGQGAFSGAVRALRSMEEQLRAARDAGRIDAVALRIGLLYGPDVPSTRELVAQARAGRLFVPRGLAGVAPFVHIADAASAIVSAIEHPSPSFVYHVVDDRPVRMTAFLDRLAGALGARPARSIPTWLVRLAAPVLAEMGSATLLLSNAKAKHELRWALQFPTLDDGLRDLTRAVAEAA